MVFLLTVSAILTTLIGITGCGSGGGPVIAKPEGSYKIGFFIDSPVEGLQYQTISWSGLTDSQGSFNFQDGEVITFSIGGIVLGRTSAKARITPVDLDSTTQVNFSTKVINITRLLLSLDQDGNPDNGITIPQSVRDALKGINVDLTNPNIDNSAGIQEMFKRLNGLGIYPEEVTQLISAEAAQIHLENTLNQLAAEDEQTAEALKNLKIQPAIGLPYSSIIMVQGQSLNLKGSIFGGKAPYTYSWSINDEKPFSTKQSPGNLAFKAKGSYTLTFTASDSTGDTKKDVRHITVFGPETQEGPFPSDSIPSASILSPAQGTIIKAGSTVNIQAMIYNGDVPLYYGLVMGAPGNSSIPQNESVVCVSPRTYLITRAVTLAAPGTYSIGIAVQDTAQNGKTPDYNAASGGITVE
jgi:hypothetical protein